MSFNPTTKVGDRRRGDTGGNGCDRRELLRRLLAAGREVAEREASAADDQRERRRQVLRRATDGLDVELLLSDAAWR